MIEIYFFCLVCILILFQLTRISHHRSMERWPNFSVNFNIELQGSVFHLNKFKLLIFFSPHKILRGFHYTFNLQLSSYVRTQRQINLLQHRTSELNGYHCSTSLFLHWPQFPVMLTVTYSAVNITSMENDYKSYSVSVWQKALKDCSLSFATHTVLLPTPEKPVGRFIWWY